MDSADLAGKLASERRFANAWESSETD